MIKNYLEFFNYLNGIGFKRDFSEERRMEMVESEGYYYSNEIYLEMEGEEVLVCKDLDLKKELRLERFFSEDNLKLLKDINENGGWIREIKDELEVYLSVDWINKKIVFRVGGYLSSRFAEMSMAS
jgi:hypothetical protein